MEMLILIIFVIIAPTNEQFNIPLPFGNIVLNKNNNGEVEIGGSQNFNLFGWGTKRNFLLTTGNGTFKIDKSDEALINGSSYGGSGSFAFNERNGIDAKQNLTLNDKTIEGGIGNESNFLEGLINLLKPKSVAKK